MTLEEVRNHPTYQEGNGVGVCAVLKDHLMWLQRGVSNSVPAGEDRLAEIGRRVLIYDEIIESLEKLSDPKLAPTATPKRKRLHNEAFKDAQAQ